VHIYREILHRLTVNNNENSVNLEQHKREVAMLKSRASPYKADQEDIRVEVGVEYVWVEKLGCWEALNFEVRVYPPNRESTLWVIELFDRGWEWKVRGEVSGSKAIQAFYIAETLTRGGHSQTE